MRKITHKNHASDGDLEAAIQLKAVDDAIAALGNPLNFRPASIGILLSGCGRAFECIDDARGRLMPLLNELTEKRDWERLYNILVYRNGAHSDTIGRYLYVSDAHKDKFKKDILAKLPPEIFKRLDDFYYEKWRGDSPRIYGVRIFRGEQGYYT